MCLGLQRRALSRHINFQKCWDAEVFSPFHLKTCFAPQRRTLVPHLNFQKCSEPDVLWHFYFHMCFAPQRRALFPHLNFQERSKTDVFCHFLLPNVLRATTACQFSSLIWLTSSAPAALASLLLDPPEPQITRKNTVFCDFPTFLRTCIFSLLTFSILYLLPSDFLHVRLSSWLCFFLAVLFHLSSRKFSFQTSFDNSIQFVFF